MPARIDLISVPVRTMPASNVSSIVNSWRALRLRATVSSSRIGHSLGTGSWPRRTNAGPMRAGVRVAYPPTGCPTRRPSPARWCSYDCYLSLHITSFRSREPYPMRRLSARVARARSGGRRQPDSTAAASTQAPRAPGRASGPRRPGPDRAASRRRPGVSPTSWIQRLSGVSQRATVSRNAPPSPDSSCHCWTVPLPNDVWPTSVARPASWSAPATISLADAVPPSMRADDPQVRARSRRRRRARRSRSGSPVGVLLPEDDARADELAGDAPRRRDVAAGVAAEIEDQLRPARRRDARPERVFELRPPPRRRTLEPDVADRAARERLGCRPPSTGRRRG